MLNRVILPRNGVTYHIGIVARISGCQNQKEVSLEDQIDHGKEEARQYCQEGIPVEYHIIATKGKGERLDRPELADVEKLLRSKKLDLLMVEDLGRLVRGTVASELCGIAVDHGVRVIAPNDCIDTADSSWEEDVISACRDHVGHNAHTSKRLKQKMMNRFRKMGASMARPIYGYIVPKDAKTYNDWKIDESAKPVITELYRRYREVQNFSILADDLKKKGVPTGPYDRSKKWNSAKVRQLMANPLLKGMPARGTRHTVKHHETGRRISVKNPAGAVYYPCPHLAHVTEEEWNEINELRRVRNQGLGRKSVNGYDPRAGLARKRTVFPGQHAQCGICGRLMYWGGHGKRTGMMCSGVREYTCWNAMSFDGRLASKRITDAVMSKLEELPDFDTAFLEKINEEAEQLHSQSNSKLLELEQEEQQLTRRIENLAEAISQTGMNDELGAMLRELNGKRSHVQRQKRNLKEKPAQTITIPTMSELKKLARSSIEQLAAESYEFGQLMNRVVRELRIFPYRICDGNRIVQRARFTLDLAHFLGTTDVSGDHAAVFRYEISVDLYDPPQRVQFREDVIRLLQEGVSIQEIVQQLGITKVAARNAVSLHRIMTEKGLKDPYVAILTPPTDDTKMKRHLHPRYCFRPIEPARTAR